MYYYYIGLDNQSFNLTNCKNCIIIIMEGKKIMKIKSELGKAIKEIRLGKGWTQTELGRALGVSSFYISLIETGSRTPSFKVAKKIKGELGVDPFF